MVLVQKWSFFHLFFLGNIGQQNLLNDILERKKAFLSYKNKKFKKAKNWNFPKRLTHGFGRKMAIFPTFFFLVYIVQENIFYVILERKNAVLDFQNNSFKKSKNWQFSKGVKPWFLSKNGHFSNFFLLGNIVLKNILTIF